MLPRLRVPGQSGDSPSPAPPRPPGSLPRPRRRPRRRLRPAAQEPPVVPKSAPKMADRAFAGPSSNTSLRGLRERLVAVAQEIAEERRRKRGVNSFTTPNKRSSCAPVMDGSVLKNDIKQQLAKERREERKRQQEANKEKQLLEKERKAKLQYEKQLEEKQRKLKEQKEKDERRRVSAEEKRKQKLAEDKEKFKAVVSRTMERCNRVDQRQKRWSWEGSAMNTENKSGKTESKRSSSLNRKENKLHANVNPKHVDNTGMTKYVFRYVTVPMFTSDELKASVMFCKSSATVPIPAKLQTPPPEKVETPLSEDVKGLAEVNVQVPAKLNMELPSKANVNMPVTMNTEDTSEVNVDTSPKVNIEVPIEANIGGHPKSKVEELPMVSVDTSPSVGSSPIVSMESSPIESVGSSSLVSVEISPVVSMDASPEANIDTSPELSMDSASLEVPSEVNLETPLKASGKLHLEASVEAHPEANVEASPKDPEMDKRTLNLATKKQPPTSIPCYRWPSSPTLGWRPPSPMKALQVKKNRPPSPLPVSTKISKQTSLSYKITPVQSILYVPNALGIIAKKRETNKRETVCRKYITNPEFGKRSMPSNEAASKIPAETHHSAYEQKDQKEKDRCTKENEPSATEQVDAMAEKANEVLTDELSPHEDELQEKDLTKKTHCMQPEDLKDQLQKGDTTLKSQDNAEMRKKEHERIMLRNVQERLERKKRVEEIMKRTRKTDANGSKALELSNNAASEEDEADDEGETESDEGSLDEMFPSGIRNSSTKIRKFHKNVKKRPQKLVFLQGETGEVDTEKKVYFNGNVKAARQKDPKDSSAQAKGTKLSTKKSSTRIARTRKAKETSAAALRSSVSVSTNQEWLSDRIIDISHHTESPAVKTIPDSGKYNLNDSVTSLQGPQVPLDHKKSSKPLFSPLGKASSYHFIQKAIDLEPSPASRYFRAPFGEDDDDSDI